MAELFISNITEQVLTKLSSVALSHVRLAWDIESELKKLGNVLSTIQSVILDANHHQSKNNQVRNWLENLQDVVYDADDLLDEMSTLSLQRKANNNLLILFSCSQSMSFGRRVKEIRERLDEIAANRRNFHFMEEFKATHLENKVREQTHSFVRASDIIGRDSDKESIVELLLKSSTGLENVTVIPIVGLGGLGKTTLVKLVHNDSRVSENFDLRMWVCVSEEFNLKQIIEKIIRSATGESSGHLDMDQSQSLLREVLDAKRYFLVLDDVWNDDRNKWVELRDLLENGTNGSKIVVTTRSKIVATITGTTPAYNLSGLSNDDCFTLFQKCAFGGQQNCHPNLVEIGKDIVRKCGGVPLAIRTVGSLLYMKTEESDWLRVRDNDIWEIDQKENDILPILRLSYDQMPAYLKQCFAYLSVFPRGDEIPREEFINLWIAQGLIDSPKGSEKLEDIGNRYFNELMSIFCFQDVVVAFDGEILACKIHNLVLDLALSVAGTECLNVKSNTDVVSERVRHVLFPKTYASDKFPESLHKARNMRSFSYFSEGQSIIGKSFVSEITRYFLHLRTLTLNSVELTKLPTSIGNLKQLRYLDLSHNRSLRSLPSSLCSLVNLQTLNLINCEQLQGLPRNSHKLVNLKTLYLTSELVVLPHGGFPSLQCLLLYKCDNLTSLAGGLQHLSSLRVLRIYECPRLVSLPSSIKHLTALEKLWIWRCEELDLLEGKGMEGLTSLRSLLLMELPKLVTLPEGLKATAASNIRYMRIAHCSNLTSLPEWLLDFTALMNLYVEDCPKLSSLPEGLQNLGAEVHVTRCALLNTTN